VDICFDFSPDLQSGTMREPKGFAQGFDPGFLCVTGETVLYRTPKLRLHAGTSTVQLIVQATGKYACR
jgi:hypothetical protein